MTPLQDIAHTRKSPSTAKVGQVSRLSIKYEQCSTYHHLVSKLHHVDGMQTSDLQFGRHCSVQTLKERMQSSSSSGCSL